MDGFYVWQWRLRNAMSYSVDWWCNDGGVLMAVLANQAGGTAKTRYRPVSPIQPCHHFTTNQQTSMPLSPGDSTPAPEIASLGCTPPNS